MAIRNKTATSLDLQNRRDSKKQSNYLPTARTSSNHPVVDCCCFGPLPPETKRDIKFWTNKNKLLAKTWTANLKPPPAINLAHDTAPFRYLCKYVRMTVIPCKNWATTKTLTLIKTSLKVERANALPNNILAPRPENQPRSYFNCNLMFKSWVGRTTLSNKLSYLFKRQNVADQLLGLI